MAVAMTLAAMNKPTALNRNTSTTQLVAGFSLALLLITATGCASKAPQPPSDFKPVQRSAVAPLVSKEELALLEESVDPVYLIGSGDVVRVEVFGRPEVSGKHIVGPDGNITVPIAGNIVLTDRTRDEARSLIDQKLRQYFTHPFVTFIVDEYSSNQVTVLGRVERAGLQKFAKSPTLAEVLANAGAMPILDKQATLTRCAIMRGREKLIWVDLKSLLNGDPAFNLRMKKGDIVYIPDSSDTAVYVLGSVPKPGSYRITPRMTLLDALAQAGGPNEDAAPKQIGVYRSGATKPEIISLTDLMDVSRKVNFALEDGDVIFVPRNTMAEIGYAMRQVISPAISVLQFGLTLETTKLQIESLKALKP
jgi:polysaccharide export outer membrane protein